VEPNPATPEVQAHEAPIVPAWLDTRQAEVYSGLSNVTLWRLRKAGKIKAAQIGRAVRYERASLDDYMQACCESA
jgi:excisionase family DNA binding protein